MGKSEVAIDIGMILSTYITKRQVLWNLLFLFGKILALSYKNIEKYQEKLYNKPIYKRSTTCLCIVLEL